jgi:serine/threonine-protein kinase
MLAGEPPFTGATMQAMLVRRLTEPPPSARAVRPNVPEGADQAIRKALSPVAADRFGTMAQLAQALQAATARVTQSAPTVATAPSAPATPAPTAQTVDGPARRRKVPVAATALLLGVLIGLGVLFAWRHAAGPGTPAGAGPARLVVLPFENLGDSADAYFASGVSDAVRGKLTELSQLQVIARGSSVQYAGSTRTPGQIAADLGVQYLLTGTVRWAKSADGISRVQVSPELVQVGGDGAAASKWQQSFEAPLSDVFKVQADIAGQVAQAMRVALPGAVQERLAEAPTHNPAAYDALLRARAATNYGANNAPADMRRAIAHYDEAVRLDSTYADAWAEMSTYLTLLYANSTPNPETARRARTAAERAVALNPQLAAGHRALGQYFLFIEADPARAAPEVESAVNAAPGDGGTISLRATVARSLGRFEEALGYARQAYALDPRSGGRAGSVAYVLHWLRRPAEAKPIAERALALTPANPTAVERLVMIALSEGDLTQARQVVARATEVAPADLAAYLAVYYDLGWALDDAGQRLVLSLGPEAFDDDPASIAIVRTQLYGWRGDQVASRAWGDSAQRHFAQQLRNTPNDPQRHVLRGLALAYAGRRDEAVAEGERGVALLPMERDAETAPYLMHQLVRIYVRAGQPEKAIDQLEKVMAVPYYLTPAWLRIDPEFGPLRGNPRFERMLKGTA